jgi:hypothetical protein
MPGSIFCICKVSWTTGAQNNLGDSKLCLLLRHRYPKGSGLHRSYFRRLNNIVKLRLPVVGTLSGPAMPVPAGSPPLAHHFCLQVIIIASVPPLLAKEICQSSPMREITADGQGACSWTLAGFALLTNPVGSRKVSHAASRGCTDLALAWGSRLFGLTCEKALGPNVLTQALLPFLHYSEANLRAAFVRS